MRFRASVGLLCTFLATASMSAHADPCGGELLDIKPVSVNADDVARLEVYFDPASRQYCATMKHQGPAVGKAAFTRVSLAACTDRSCREAVAPVLFDSDIDYVDSAGPLRLRTRDISHCVAASGTITYAGVTQNVRSTPLCR